MTKDSPKAATKSTIFQTLSEKTELTCKQISSVFEALEGLIKSELGKKPFFFTRDAQSFQGSPNRRDTALDAAMIT